MVEMAAYRSRDNAIPRSVVGFAFGVGTDLHRIA
jgi:hypothetical protein